MTPLGMDQRTTDVRQPFFVANDGAKQGNMDISSHASTLSMYPLTMS